MSASFLQSGVVAREPDDDRALFILRFFKGCLRGYKRLRRPFVNELVDFLFPLSASPGVDDGNAHASSDSATNDFFCVEYLGEVRYRMAKSTRNSSTADRTGSFW